MPITQKPAKVSIRAYQVGFGDCLLLTFHYASKKRHVLVDFGSTRRPEGASKTLLHEVAKAIEQECGKKLTAIIASHRHRDHIDGFRTNKKGTGPGDVIRALKPDLVLQPWTEDPKAPRDAKSAVSGVTPFAFRRSLTSMHAAAGDVLRQLKSFGDRIPKPMAEQLGFLGEDNISNRSAVVNLMNMAPNEYLSYGSKTRLESLLPGVKVHILGPPTLKDTNSILRQRDEDEQEFWHLHQRFWQFRGNGAGNGSNGGRQPLFPTAPRTTPDAPNIAWFISRLTQVHASNLLSICRILDDAMNNTSLIVLFEVGKKLLLFPGDAQYENWMYALDPSRPWRKKLKGVHVYKVGHHGSLNATPRTLWKGFANATETQKKGRLKTVLSTLKDVHGHAEEDTEVPRRTLVDALKLRSDFVTTEALTGGTLSQLVVLDV